MNAIEAFHRAIERSNPALLGPIALLKHRGTRYHVNVTNGNSIAEIFGEDTDHWNGGKIVLFTPDRAHRCCAAF